MKEKEQYYIIPYIVSITSYPVLVRAWSHRYGRRARRWWEGVAIMWAKPSDNIGPRKVYSINSPMESKKVMGPFNTLAEAKRVFIVALL